MLATKDFIPNLVAGLFMLKKTEIEKGKRIKAGNVEGTVVEIGLIETKIKTKKGDEIYIPNSTLTKEKLVVKKS
jgi:small-conductance mechanosensitive channel